jgi:hypothetical protein
MKNLLELHLVPHSHLGAFGLTGAGKSYGAHRLLLKQRHYQILYMVNYGKDPLWDGLKVWNVSNISVGDGLRYAIEHSKRTPIIINDSGPNIGENLAYVWAFCLANGWTACVLFDEVQNYQDDAERWTNEGRKHGLTTIYTSVRPETIKNVNITSNTVLYWVFACSSKMVRGLERNYGVTLEPEVIEHINKNRGGAVVDFAHNSALITFNRVYLADKSYSIVKVLDRLA